MLRAFAWVEKVVAVHCSGKPERGAGMPEMPEITRAEFDHQQLEAGHSLVAVGGVTSEDGVGRQPLVIELCRLTCLVWDGGKVAS